MKLKKFKSKNTFLSKYFYFLYVKRLSTEIGTVWAVDQIHAWLGTDLNVAVTGCSQNKSLYNIIK